MNKKVQNLNILILSKNLPRTPYVKFCSLANKNTILVINNNKFLRLQTFILDCSCFKPIVFRQAIFL